MESNNSNSNNVLNLTQYNNQSGSDTERSANRGRPGRPANNTSNNNNNSDQRRAVAQASTSSQIENNQRNNNATSDFSTMADELLARTLLNNQRTAVSAK